MLTLHAPDSTGPFHAQTDGAIYVSMNRLVDRRADCRELVDELADVLGPDFAGSASGDLPYNRRVDGLLLDHDPDLERLELWLRRAAKALAS